MLVLQSLVKLESFVLVQAEVVHILAPLVIRVRGVFFPEFAADLVAVPHVVVAELIRDFVALLL